MIVAGDCREMMPLFGPFDLIIADPPYGETALAWDQRVEGWEAVALASLKPGGSMWVFGSMRYFMSTGVPAGWRLAQDIVWAKPNGSGFAKDRFRRVHEHAVHFYPEGQGWSATYNAVQRVPYTGPDKSARRSAAAAHARPIGPGDYVDDGTRLVRSIVEAKPPRDGRHNTAKPVDLLALLIRTSCPSDGVVGDFFAGSGSAGLAAHEAGRRYVGCELRAEVAAAARHRLNAAPLSP